MLLGPAAKRGAHSVLSEGLDPRLASSTPAIRIQSPNARQTKNPSADNSDAVAPANVEMDLTRSVDRFGLCGEWRLGAASFGERVFLLVVGW
jgi:hypothetical protein